MDDLVFVPCPRPTTAAPRGGAPIVYVRPPLFVLRGVYFHPILETEHPLPPHRWALVNSSRVISSEGTTSDEQGISSVFRPTLDPELPDDTWDLWLIPIFDDGTPSSDIVTYGEVWIDVDRHRWVSAKELKIEDTGGVIENRRLLRIPRWSTARKTEYGGGFKEENVHSSIFAATGLLETTALVPHGTPALPWTIRIDQGWMRSYIQLRFYDAIARKERSLPQGIVLEAHSARFQTLQSRWRVGASSVRLSDGSIYILHARTAADAGDLNYKFGTPKETRLLYADDTYVHGQRLGTDYALLEKEYMLAEVWHSFGMEAWEGARDASSEWRKPFAEIRTRGQSWAMPLSFHLDDLVLVDAYSVNVSSPPERLGIYDGLAALRDPQKSPNGKDLPSSKITTKQPLLRAEEATFQRGRGLDGITRFIEHEGAMYDLTFAFHSPALRESPYVGARAARLAMSVAKTAGGDLYLFDTRWLRHTYDGRSMRLAHLILHVSMFIDGSKLNKANHDAITILEELMIPAANQWDQNHPAVSGSQDLPKNYAFASAAGLRADATVVKLRHLFTRRTRAREDRIRVELETQPGRASAGHPMILYCAWGREHRRAQDPAWLLEKPSTKIPNAKLKKPPYAFGYRGDETVSDIDQTRERPFVFAHELGHECGLGDEYLEGIRTDKIHPEARGDLPRFENDPQPYFFDKNAFMRGNLYPRLRYLHHQTEHLNSQTSNRSDWLAAESPFAAWNISNNRTYQFVLPTSGPNHAAVHGPWDGIQGKHGFCNLTLFSTSEDEGMSGPVYLPEERHLAIAFDGILVIQPKIWFSFVENFGDTLEQWNAFARWAASFTKPKLSPRFLIETQGVDTFRKVAIILQPLFEFEPVPMPKGGDNAATFQTKSDATLEIMLRKTGPGTVVNWMSTPTRVISSMNHLGVGDWIMRFAMARQPANGAIVPSAGQLESADLLGPAETMAAMLGRSNVSSTVRRYDG